MHTFYNGQKNLFCVNWKKIGPVFFALVLGSSTYLPTILELRELKTDVSDWKTNNGPNVVSLPIFGSSHQPGNGNNNKDLVRTLPTNILFTIIFVNGGEVEGVEWVEWVGGGGLMTDISVENSTWTFPQYSLFHFSFYGNAYSTLVTKNVLLSKL